MDKTMGIDDLEEVQRKRGEELRMHLVRSKSVALIKVINFVAGAAAEKRL